MEKNNFKYQRLIKEKDNESENSKKNYLNFASKKMVMKGFNNNMN